MRIDRRHGFTVLELLVSISVIGLLVALILPVVLAAREGSRRLQCTSRLRDFGAALHGFEAARQVFPPAQRATVNSPVPMSFHFYSPHVYLLPFFDQKVVAAAIDTTRPQYYFYNPDGLDSVARQPVSAFRCPSDHYQSGNNYRFCLGTGPGTMKSGTSPGGNGPFECLRAHSAADIRDGLSSTIAVSEKLQGTSDATKFSVEDYWYSGIINVLNVVPPLDEMVQICSSLQGQPSHFQPYVGKTWYLAAYDFTWYNHAVSPNSKVFDCSAQSMNSATTKPGDGVYKASSNHSGGVMCVFMDGHTRFISDGIDLQVWRALSTRSGSDPVSDSQF